MDPSQKRPQGPKTGPFVKVSEIIWLLFWAKAQKCKECVWIAQAWTDCMSDLPENYTFGDFAEHFVVFSQEPLFKHSVGADGADENQSVRN